MEGDSRTIGDDNDCDDDPMRRLKITNDVDATQVRMMRATARRLATQPTPEPQASSTERIWGDAPETEAGAAGSGARPSPRRASASKRPRWSSSASCASPRARSLGGRRALATGKAPRQDATAPQGGAADTPWAYDSVGSDLCRLPLRALACLPPGILAQRMVTTRVTSQSLSRL